jgi:hypothetical protein
MPDAVTAAAQLPVDPATVTTWPAAVVSLAGIVLLIVQQFRQSRITRRVEHEVTANSGSSMRDTADRIETKLDAHIADEPRRRARARAEAGALALLGAAISIAVTLNRTR